tara:strand:+ start:106 stop:282 length:177 start_codon:yes stop_codon:yes gene_type:complete
MLIEDEILDDDEVNDMILDMSLSDVLGVLLKAGRTDLIASWDSIHELCLDSLEEEVAQ